MKLLAWLLTMTFGLLGLLGTARSASAQVSEAEQVARAFIDAINAGDADAMRALVVPGIPFMLTGGPSYDSPFQSEATLDDYIRFSEGVTLSINSLTNVDPNTVEIEVTLSGDRIPRLSHPYVSFMRITVKDGQITGFAEHLSEETVGELQHGGPGMPTTGARHLDLVLLGLVLGLLSLTVGVAARRSHSTR
jgi:hypothetical protein